MIQAGTLSSPNLTFKAAGIGMAAPGLLGSLWVIGARRTRLPR
jgi:hypothetical protein